MAHLSEDSYKLIEIATNLVGSKERVREILGCSREAFEAYEKGAQELPVEELGNLVTAIVEAQHELIARQREMLRKLRR
jgi:hypothetical protein